MSEKSEENQTSDIVRVSADPNRKVIKRAILNKIPEDISNNPELLLDIEQLPKNYNFEILKTIWRIKQLNAKRVALQMPEGLLMYAIVISDIIEKFTRSETIIMGDVTYGACCIDDITCKSLDVDLLIHYGHSCLIPVSSMLDIKVLYVFVDIKIDVNHLINTVEENFAQGQKIALVSTIQFLSTLHEVGKYLSKKYSIEIPKSSPLSPGEVLGCTSPVVKRSDVIIYVGDGRFHLEAAMIANPRLDAYRYDPYDKKITKEFYGHSDMLLTRSKAIEKGSNAEIFGLILGTLGRQGSVNVLRQIKNELKAKNKESVTFLMSEIFPDKLNSIDSQVGCWIQVACPRLSIDWGRAFNKPLLTPYEANVILGNSSFESVKKRETNYPMDFYANDSLGSWTPNYRSSNN